MFISTESSEVILDREAIFFRTDVFQWFLIALSDLEKKVIRVNMQWSMAFTLGKIIKTNTTHYICNNIERPNKFHKLNIPSG